MEFNWKAIAHLIFFVAICIGVLAVFAADHARADENVSIPFITQGMEVGVGDTVDVSGVVPPYPQLAYWDGYDMYDTPPTYNLTMPNYKSEYYKFNISEEVFGNRLGKWYKYDGKYERQGNNLAFVVKRKPMLNYTMTLQNGTVLNLTHVENVTYTPYVIKKTLPLPDKHVADYLVTREEAFNISVDKTAAVWIFNSRNNDIMYSTNNYGFEVVFKQSVIKDIEPGEYKILIQKMGNLTNGLDVLYDSKTRIIKWFDRQNFKVREIDATNLEPENAVSTLKQIFPHVPDQFEIKRIAVQEPSVSIVTMDKLYSANAKEYFHDIDMRGNVTLMDVRGYTNVLPGTNITVVLDENRVDPRLVSKIATYRGVAEGDYLGDMRQYRIYVPLYWDSLAPGIHTLTARTEKGGIMYADFIVSEMPEDSYVPEPKVRYVEDRNPWVPTPTPVVIEKSVEVPGPERVVTKEVPPSPEVVLEQQRVAYWEGVTRLAVVAGIVVVGIVILIGLVWAYRTHKRTMKEREWFRRQT